MISSESAIKIEGVLLPESLTSSNRWLPLDLMILMEVEVEATKSKRKSLADVAVSS